MIVIVVKIMQEIIDKKRIAKNSLMLYIRMLFLMVVSLYSTRILLKALGIDDFGIYNVVGGVVVIFSFVSNTLSSATQRFVSYALGKEDYNLLKKTFRMSATIFIGIGLLLIFF